MDGEYEVMVHVSRLKALWLIKYLKRPTNYGKVSVKDVCVNRDAFQGDSFTMTWLKNIVIEDSC